ncbi:HAMP domain-containing sensor histidine kinase [Saccharopolyspora sp. NPDC047091]|uniref:sensor histidine kinase n=1 Tax=Saccharopolyspora sp. NPDC047091 TaxID=3155924 RepID=UPI0033D4EB32
MNPGRTLATRLTITYTALTAVIGALLLAGTLALAWWQLPDEVMEAVPAVSADDPNPPPPPIDPEVIEVRADATTALLLAGLAGLVVFVALAAVLGRIMAVRALRPVHLITETARRAAEQDLAVRIGLDGPSDEVKRLADTFDHMLVRLESSFTSQSRFIANAAHELRTPVATARTLAEVAQARPGASPDALRLAGKVLENTARQEALLTGLLALAQNTETLRDKQQPVDLARLTGDVLDSRAAGGLAVRAERAPAVVPGDPVLLGQLVRNLVDNACLHNVPGGWIELRTGTAGGRTSLTVANSGAVIEPADESLLFEPFRRLHLDRVQRPRGSGLGLSVVRAVAEAHGGTAVAHPLDGGGLRVEVDLPAAPARTPELVA